MSIFDTHAHYFDEAFETDRTQLLTNLAEKGVGHVLECSVDEASAYSCLKLAEQFSFMRVAVGLHPEEVTTMEAAEQSLDALLPLYENPLVCAVGEIGLDYHWDTPRDVQHYAFTRQCKLAAEKGLPVVVHDREAHQDVYDILLSMQPKGVLHCYSGSAESAVPLIQAGFYFGFGGALTFKNAKRAVQAAAAIPMEHILLETDCPYMAPVPCRGQRCDSSLIIHVARVLAEIKQLTVEEVIAQTETNAKRLFGDWDAE